MSELLGADRLIAKCRRLASKKAGEDIVLRAVHNAAKKVVQADAKRLAPGNNGELRNSIKTRVKMDGDKAIGEVYTNLHYAPYVEFGTGSRGQSTNTNTEVKVNYRSDWSGNRAQPFLWPALRENRNNSIKIIREEIRKAVK